MASSAAATSAPFFGGAISVTRSRISSDSRCGGRRLRRPAMALTCRFIVAAPRASNEAPAAPASRGGALRQGSPPPGCSRRGPIRSATSTVLGNLLDREIRVAHPALPRNAVHSTSSDRSGPTSSLNCCKLLVAERLRGDVDEIALGRMPVLPVDRVARRIGEALQLAQRLGQHRGVVLLVDDPVAPLVLLQQRRREPVVAETAAALPAHRLGDAALDPSPSMTFFRRGMMCVWQCSPSSTMIQRRPILCATAPVVPEPAKESRIRSPGSVQACTIRSIRPSGLGNENLFSCPNRATLSCVPCCVKCPAMIVFGFALRSSPASSRKYCL